MSNLDEQAREILRGNDKGGYTVPTHGLYPYQWNWDSAFVAWGFSTFDNNRAWVELETLFNSQWKNGMVPHIIFHQQDPGYFPGPDYWQAGDEPPSSGISQPPVAAIMARLVYEADPKAGKKRLKALLPKLIAFHKWYRDYRCRMGVATVTHPWESGRDNCPDWDIGMADVDGTDVGEYQRRDTGHVDASMRPTKIEYDKYIALVKFGRDRDWDAAQIMADTPFLMADPAIHFILIRAHRDLAWLAEELGQDGSIYRAWAEELVAASPIIWNQDLGCYDARNMRTGGFAHNLSSGAFMMWLAGIENEVAETRLMRIWDGAKYGIPSNDPGAPNFDPRRYWRGPTWPVVNSLIALGFRSSGRIADEARLRQETIDLIKGDGFYEYFDPIMGTGCGGPDFSWTAAIWLAWANR